MSFLDGLRSRQKAFAIDDRTAAIVRGLQPLVARDVERVLRGYYESWNALPGFSEFAERHAGPHVGFQSDYYARMFDGRMDDAYVERLRETIGREMRDGYGPRIRCWRPPSRSAPTCST